MGRATEKILIIQLRQIGDVLLTTPAARALREAFPAARLDFLTQPPSDQLLGGNPYIDNVLVYDRTKPLRELLRARREGYDIVVDFLSNPRSALLTALSGARVKAGPGYTASAWAYNRKFLPGPERPYSAFRKIDALAVLGVSSPGYRYPELFPSPEDQAWADAAFAAAGFPAGPVLAFAPASRRITRQWPPQHYARLAARCAAELGACVMVLWGPGEKDLAEKVAGLAASGLVRPAPETSTLLRLAALIRKSVLTVSNCSGTKHIAQAAGVSTLGIYGSSDPAHWTPPDDPEHQTVRDEALDCIACRRNYCDIGIKCLRDLSPDTVFAKLLSMPAIKRLGRGAS